jgi:hypothetical protein
MMPHEERQLQYRRCFILPPDLRDDPAFALDSYNWSSFGIWESTRAATRVT